MRKAIAAIGASILGVGGALVAGAAPASAAPLPVCDNANDHVVNPDVGPGDTWYMTCTPRYGLGKVEFTITTPADDPFPAGYSLTDGHQSVTSTPTSAQDDSYFEPFWEVDYSGEPATYTGAFINLNEIASTDDSQTYGQGSGFIPNQQTTMAFLIKSVGLAASLPSVCTSDASDPTYDAAYEVTYEPTTTTFSETIDSVVHKVTVTFTPAPLFLGLNFDTSGDGNDADGFDTSAPICAVSGSVSHFAASDDADGADWYSAAFLAATNAPDFMTTLDPVSQIDGFPTATDLGSFAATSTPVLATTGVDAAPTGLLGAGLLSVGILGTIVGVVRRRRRFPVGSR